MELDASVVAVNAVDVCNNRTPQDKPGRDVVADEFGDFDDDIFEDLMVEIESKQPSQNRASSGEQPALKAHGGDAGGLGGNGDEWFGDDAFGGDVDFEAVEQAATQSVRSTGGTTFLSNVRPVR